MSYKMPRKICQITSILVCIVFFTKAFKAYFKHLLSLIAFFTFSAQSSELEIHYTFVKSSNSTYSIVIDYNVGDKTTSYLTLPLSWANATSAHLGVMNLQVLPSTVASTKNGSTQIELTHKPFQDIQIRYDLEPVAASSLDPTKIGYTLPVIRDSYFHWIGITSLVMPYLDISFNEKVKVQVQTKGFSEEFPLYASLKKLEGSYVFEGLNVNFLRTVFVAGDYRKLYDQSPSGQTVLFLRGDWAFDDETFFTQFKSIIQNQKAYWGDMSVDSAFWGVVSPLDKHENPYVVASNGIALNNSFTAFFTQNLHLENINFLFSHEVLHHWLPNAFGDVGKDKNQIAWFSEGFTNYISNQILLKSHVINEVEYNASLKEAHSLVTTSSLKERTNSQLVASFFAEAKARELVYARGMVLAHMWDIDISKSTNGEKDLRDMLLAMMNDFQLKKLSELNGKTVVDFAQKFGAYKALVQSENILKLD